MKSQFGFYYYSVLAWTFGVALCFPLTVQAKDDLDEVIDFLVSEGEQEAQSKQNSEDQQTAASGPSTNKQGSARGALKTPSEKAPLYKMRNNERIQ